MHPPSTALILTLSACFLLAANAQAATEVSLSPLADAYVSNEYPHANYGEEGTLYVHAGSNTKRTYLMFDLGPVDHASISLATLHLFFGQGGAQLPTVIDLHHVLSDGWTESGLNWSNKPTYTVPPLATASTQFGQAEVTWSLPAHLFTFDTDGRLSLLLKLQDEGISDTATFFSKEATVHPAIPSYLTLAVPEPEIWMLMLAGMGLIAWRKPRNRQRCP